MCIFHIIFNLLTVSGFELWKISACTMSWMCCVNTPKPMNKDICKIKPTLPNEWDCDCYWGLWSKSRDVSASEWPSVQCLPAPCDVCGCVFCSEKFVPRKHRPHREVWFHMLSRSESQWPQLEQCTGIRSSLSSKASQLSETGLVYIFSRTQKERYISFCLIFSSVFPRDK